MAALNAPNELLRDVDGRGRAGLDLVEEGRVGAVPGRLDARGLGAAPNAAAAGRIWPATEAARAASRSAARRILFMKLRNNVERGKRSTDSRCAVLRSCPQ